MFHTIVLILVAALCALPASVLGFTAFRWLVAAALHGELDELRRRLDENAAAIMIEKLFGEVANDVPREVPHRSETRFRIPLAQVRHQLSVGVGQQQSWSN